MGWFTGNLLNGYGKKVAGHKLEKEGLYESDNGSQQLRNCYAITQYDFRKALVAQEFKWDEYLVESQKTKNDIENQKKLEE